VAGRAPEAHLGDRGARRRDLVIMPVARARHVRRRPVRGRVVSLVLAVLALVAAVGSVVTVYRVGDSGARAVWTGHVSAQAQPPLRPPRS